MVYTDCSVDQLYLEKHLMETTSLNRNQSESTSNDFLKQSWQMYLEYYFITINKVKIIFHIQNGIKSLQKYCQAITLIEQTRCAENYSNLSWCMGLISLHQMLTSFSTPPCRFRINLDSQYKCRTSKLWLVDQ